MKKVTVYLFAALALLVAGGLAAQQKDNLKCKDHPLFTRMPGYWIHSCDDKQFDAHDFVVGKGQKEHVEGHLWRISYYPQNDLPSKPSELQIQRNFENAVQKLGGKVVWSEKGRSTLKLDKDGKELWIEVTAEFTGKHGLRIVQREGMTQEIVANAQVFQNEIRAAGHAAVYGITFDTDSANIKPESAVAVGEIAKLLKTDAGLKIFVVGHTDNTGSVDHNLKLSQDRAQAVLQALARDHGIAPARLKSHGCGPFAPVASNDTEDGRAKNRRVELVKQ
jgi:outer membrane protein OmpA-like peptidoglycan-associated protein